MTRAVVAFVAAAASAVVAAPAQAPSEPAVDESIDSGLVAELPFVGKLTWGCDAPGRYFTRLRLPDPGATVFVSLVSVGRRVLRNRQVDPHPTDPARSGARPFRTSRSQTWTIRYHHKPATVRVVARLRFASAEVVCVPARSVIDVRSDVR